MTQHPGLQTVRDLLGKLERELGRLQSDVSADTYFNFAVTAYHICDWIEGDSTVPNAARRDLPNVRRLLPIQVCRDIANGSKHFRLNYTNAVVADATCIAPSYDVGRYGAGPFGVGESVIQVTLADGTLRDGLELAREATRLWRDFFARHLI